MKTKQHEKTAPGNKRESLFQTILHPTEGEKFAAAIVMITSGISFAALRTLGMPETGGGALLRVIGGGSVLLAECGALAYWIRSIKKRRAKK